MTRPVKLYRVALEDFTFAWSVGTDFSVVCGLR